MTSTPISAAAYAVVDSVRTVLAAVWPRSAVRSEIERLREDGYLEGEACEMAFSLEFGDTTTADVMVRTVRAAGFSVDAAQAQRGFLTARLSVLLQPHALAQAVTRLERVVRSSGGFVAVIGPTHAPALEAAPSLARERAMARATGRDSSGSIAALA